MNQLLAAITAIGKVEPLGSVHDDDDDDDDDDRNLSGSVHLSPGGVYCNQLLHCISVDALKLSCNILCVQRIATILQCNLRAGERPFYVRARIPQESFNLEFSSRAQRQRLDEEQRQWQRVDEE